MPCTTAARILVVGHTASSTTVTLQKLERVGCAFDSVDTVAEAEAAMRTTPFDIVLAAETMPDGRGYEGVFPSLAGNPVVEAGDPLSLISIVLLGSKTSRTSTTPAQFAMPAFAWRLTDQDAADIISFIRSSWGNDAKPIGAPKVAALR